MPGSHYQALSLEELRASTERGLKAIIESLNSGSYARLESYLTDVCITRLAIGFSVEEVIQALLLFKKAALPVFWRIHTPADNGNALLEMVSKLDACAAWMASRFGALHAAETSRRLQREQEQATRTLDTFFNCIPMGIAVFGRDLRLRRCNPTWTEYVDRYIPSSAKQVVPGVCFFDLVPGIEEQAMPILERVLAGEKVRQEALRLESDGVVSYLDMVFTPLIENGQVTGFVNVTTNVTAREKMLEAPQESETHLRSLLENATNFVVYRLAVDETNPYGARVLLVSPSIKEIIGISNPYRFEGWFENLHPDDLQKAKEANQRAIQNGQPYSQEVRVFHPGKKTWIWVHTASTPVFDAEGKLTHFNGLIIDISKQKRAEQAVQVAYQTLEARIEARTRELQTILAVTAAASSSLDLDEMLRAALDRLVTLVGASRAGVMLLNPETGELGNTSHPELRKQSPEICGLGWKKPIESAIWSPEENSIFFVEGMEIAPGERGRGLGYLRMDRMSIGA